VLAEYLQRLEELGAVERWSGRVMLNPRLQPVQEALHHVLAGGEVEVRVVQEGNPDIVQELTERVNQVAQEASAGQSTGFSLFVTI
jgi:hypothetical protein